MNKRVIVIGGGAAGMMASYSAAKSGCEVIILEKTDSCGNKLRLTGNGRCNLTNTAPVDDFLTRYGRHGSFLRDCFRIFFARDVVLFLKDSGVDVVVERGRVFPRVGGAASVLRAFDRTLRRHRVKVVTNTRVQNIMVSGSRVTGVQCDHGGSFEAHSVVLATGGLSYPQTGSSGDGYTIAKRAGHTIVRPLPGLVPLEIDHPSIRYLKGLSMDDVELTVQGKGRKKFVERGSVVFTHYGISGPAVLALSNHAVDFLQRGTVHLRFNFFPAVSTTLVDKKLNVLFTRYGARKITNALGYIIPARMASSVIKFTGVAENRKCCDVTRDERRSLVECMTDLTYTVIRSRPISEAMVTRGGVSLKEVDPRTLESRSIRGLYFCGEILDIDGECGGFNLQAAFSTGYVAGQHATRRVRDVSDRC